MDGSSRIEVREVMHCRWLQYVLVSLYSFVPREGRSLRDGMREGKEDLSGAVRLMRNPQRGWGSGQRDLMDLCS